jgi:hypothetical protein
MRARIWAPLFVSGLIALQALAAIAAPTTVRLKSRTFLPQPSLEALDQAADAGQAGGYFFVQTAAPVDAATRSRLGERGVRLVGYIPDQTWTAWISEAAMRDPAARAMLAWVGPIQPEDKTPPRWRTEGIGGWCRQPDGRLEIRVQLHEEIALRAVESRLRTLGAEIIGPLNLFPGFTVLVQEWVVPMLSAMDEVLWVAEGLPELELANDGNRANVGAEVLQLAPYGLDGAGVNVGIWDGGLVDANHDDFAGRLTLGEGGGTNDHATHVAGTFGGSGVRSDQEGGTPLEWRGMAPSCAIYSWNFSGDVPNEVRNGVGDFQLDLETNSWTWGVNGGNCSLYGDYDDWAPDFDAIVLGAGGRKLNVSFAAANERDDNDCGLQGGYACIPPPSTAKNIICVGATNSDDDTMTSFSSWGPVDDGRLKPDVTAPGCEHFGEGHVHSTLPGDNYGGPGWCGTSMATPTTTGVLALLYQLYNQQNAGADPEPSLMKALLIGTAVDLGRPGPDYTFGNGRIDGRVAANALIDDSPLALTVNQGDTHDFVLRVQQGTPKLRVALVWDDAVGNPLADPALVNDLDLVLIDPAAQPHYPWVLNPDSPSQNATQGPDHLNNVEHVEVVNPMNGDWTVRVTGGNVPEGPVSAGLVGLDSHAPAAPGDLAVVDPTESSLSLTWTNASNLDRRGTLIARALPGSLWFGPVRGQTYTVGQVVAPGVTIIYVADEDHSVNPLVDSGLESDQTYRYTAHSFDDVLNYSIGVSENGTTEAGSSSVEGSNVPKTLALGPARPNPATSRMTFTFEIPARTSVEVHLFDAAGRRVRTLVDAPFEAGVYTGSWDGQDEAGRDLPAGVYFYELRAGGERLSQSVSWTR